MTCEVNPLLNHYNAAGIHLTEIAILIWVLGTFATVQSFFPVVSLRRKMLWLWIGFFCGAALMGVAMMHQQVYRQVASTIDLPNLANSQAIPAGCSLLRSIHAYFGNLVTTNGLNWVYFVVGEVFFVANVISLLAYMWIPPLVQHGESESESRS